MRLKEARVIITGASSGIGRAVAEELAARGSRVVLASRNGAQLDDVASIIEGRGGRVFVVPTDVTHEGAADRLVDETVRQLGGVDVLVNNAGIGLHDGIVDASWADVEALFRLNVLAAAAMIRAVARPMRSQRSGMIVNISSLAGRIVVPRIGYYSASKFALTAIGDALRMEEAHRGLRVMNVFPGTTRTNFTANRLGVRGRAAHQRVAPVSSEKVARRIARAIERNQQSVYVSLVPDRLGVAANHVAGWAVSAVLRRWARGAQN